MQSNPNQTLPRRVADYVDPDSGVVFTLPLPEPSEHLEFIHEAETVLGDLFHDSHAVTIADGDVVVIQFTARYPASIAKVQETLGNLLARWLMPAASWTWGPRTSTGATPSIHEHEEN